LPHYSPIVFDEFGLNVLTFTKNIEKKTEKKRTLAGPVKSPCGPNDVRGPQFENTCYRLSRSITINFEKVKPIVK